MNAPTVFEILHDSMRGQYTHLAAALNSLVPGLALGHEEAWLLVNLVIILWSPNEHDDHVATSSWLHWLNALSKGRKRAMEPSVQLDHRQPEVSAFQQLSISIVRLYREIHNAIESVKGYEQVMAER